jgi:chromosome segregation ATPase
MTDIVERLRKAATSIYIAVERPIADDISADLREAAAEIERLKASKPDGLTWQDGREAGRNEAMTALQAEYVNYGWSMRELRAEVERLREHVKRREDHYAALLAANEAEIERLRAALRHYVIAYEECRDVPSEVERDARAALEPKP